MREHRDDGDARVVRAAAPMILNLGCGRAKALPAWAEDSGDVRHVDEIESVNPDVVMRFGYHDLPFPAESVDAAYALHVLEHIGPQCDSAAWFYFWEDLYRVMKPNAKLHFECPYYTSMWAWADPTHVRAISELTFLYLSQDSYRQGGSIPDYRPQCDFVAETMQLLPDPQMIAKESVSWLRGTLRAVKPFKPYWETA